MSDTIAAMPNFRDAGGHETSGGGRMRRGFLYRSDQPAGLGAEDLSRLSSLGLLAVYDLRTAAEVAMEPALVPAGATRVRLDVLADEQDGAPARIIAMLSNPPQASRELGDGRAAAMFTRVYRSLVSTPSAIEGYRRFCLGLLDEQGAPALVHCTTGKDRTGWAAASTLLLLGVSEQDVLYDYELTNRDLLPALKPMFEHFRAAGGDPKLLEPVLGVEAEYLRAALDEMNTKFGSIEGYFADGLGIDADGQQRLRDELVESS